ncbi:MAG: ABC transporter permease [Rhodospirillales bacterium]|nr:ABC transporter permease [Rhodospirillales bacterium]
MAAETGTTGRARGRGESVTRRMFRLAWEMTSFKIGLGVFTVLVGAAIIWPELSPYDPMKISVRERFLPPIFLEGGTWAHIAGTDQLGRDLFVRSLVGLRNGLGIAAAAVAIMFVVGCALGVISGYWGRWVDIILMRITDAQLSIPVIVLAITILSVSRPNPFTVTAVLVLAGWPIYARVVRSIALAEREREYVRGAKILGASDLRIAALMISPNILPPIAFVAVLDIARMMIFEALFGFLGIGIQPPTPTFGNIIADGYKYLVNSWWIPTMPGVFLILTLISINLMGASLERARNKLFKGIV